MASVIFYPERRKNDLGVLRVRNVPILMFFNFEGKRMQFYTGERVDMKDWDFEQKRVLPSHTDYKSINEYLEFLSKRIRHVYRESKMTGISPAPTQLKKMLRDSFRSQQKSFFDLLILFIEENHQRWTLSTYRKVKTLYGHLRRYSDKMGAEPELSRIDQYFLDSLINYFRVECNHIDSTIRKNLEVLYWFLNWAFKKGNLRDLFWKKSFEHLMSLRNTESEMFYLQMAELILLYQFPLNNKKESLAKDIFCFACLTGLTVHELRHLKPSDIQDEWIRIESGSRRRNIPMLPHVRMIAAKYRMNSEETLFPKIYAHKVNRYMKETGRKAGLTREIRIIQYVNGESREMMVPAYRLLTLSNARRTFILLSLQMGLEKTAILNMAGYKSWKTLELKAEKMEKLKAQEIKKFNAL